MKISILFPLTRPGVSPSATIISDDQLRSYAILDLAEALLEAGTPAEVVLSIIRDLRSFPLNKRLEAIDE